MDPLSIAANVVGVTAFCAKLIQGIGRFVVDVRGVPETLTHFYSTIQNLQAALLGIESALRQRPEQLPFEKDHHHNISQIIQSCQSALENLDHLLPDLREDSGAYDRIRANLIISVKKNAVQHHIVHIESYTQVLQLSLTTLSLGSLWKTQRSQEQIHAAIRNLTDSIRSANLLPRPGGTSVSGSTLIASEANVEDANTSTAPSTSATCTVADADSTTALAQEIQAWQRSATEMAEVLSLYEPDQMPRVLADDGSDVSRHLPSDSGIGLLEYDGGGEEAKDDGDTFDPEPDHPDCPSREILESHFEQNQRIVTQFVHCGIFMKAASYQRKAIGYKSQLADVYQVSFPYAQQADMQEFLAEILVNNETRESCQEARQILEALLKNEVSRAADEVDQGRRCRLYHKLGKMYLGEGNTRQARRFLSRAFEGRKDLESTPRDLVLESVDLLVKVLQMEQAFDEARGYLEWKKQHFPAAKLALSPPLPVLPSSLGGGPSSTARASVATVSAEAAAASGTSMRASITGATITAEEFETMAIKTDTPDLNVAPVVSPASPSAAFSEMEPRRATVVTTPAVPVATPGAGAGGAAGLSNAFAWCVEKQFDVDDPSFCFEVYDSNRNTSPLHLVLREENIDIFRQMVDHVVYLEHRDSKFCTPLLVAAGTRNRETTRLLLERGAKVDVRDGSSLSPLHRCQNRTGGVKVARLLLQYLPVPQPPQQPAASSSASTAPQSLAPGDAKPHLIDAADANGRTAFFMAMDNGNEAMARFLLSEGANPDITDALGKTALFMACERVDERMARCALDYGANVNVTGPGLRTPLVAAIEAAGSSIAKCALIKLLLEHGADPRIPDADGRTAFAVARSASFSSEIKWLLQQNQQHRSRVLSATSMATAPPDANRPVTKHASQSSRSSSFASGGSRR